MSKHLNLSIDDMNRLHHFINNLQTNPIAIVMIGSNAHSRDMLFETSDIDIVIFSEDIGQQVIKDSLHKFDILMEPVYIKDYQGERIETFIDIDGKVLDITWTLPKKPEMGTTIHEILNGNFEIHIASIYQHGIPIYGEIPNIDYIRERYLPFYSDLHRQFRLAVIEDNMCPIVNLLTQKINMMDNDILDTLVIVRRIFLQWLFIFKRKYPFSYTKRVEKQLIELLNLEKEIVVKILCCEGADIFEIAYEFINIVKKLKIE